MQKLTEYQELLVITMEECGELIQACSKAVSYTHLTLPTTPYV